jgi:hypothetical protein
VPPVRRGRASLVQLVPPVQPAPLEQASQDLQALPELLATLDPPDQQALLEELGPLVE